MKTSLAFLSILCAMHCQRTPDKQNNVVAKTPLLLPKDTIISYRDRLNNSNDSIPVDLYAPKKRGNIDGWWMPEDEITPKGNFVKYLISRDSCCIDNLYLKWGNKRCSNLESLGCLRLFNPRMNPYFVSESDKYLFMISTADGGMPTASWNLWLFPLVSGHHSEVYSMVAPDAYDQRSMTIVREVEKNKTDYNFLEAYNITTRRVKPIMFKNRLRTIAASWAIDSISITAETIFLSVQTYDKSDRPVDETIVLPNDIKQ